MFTPAEFRSQFLPGLVFADEYGRPLPDAIFAAKIQAAVASFERVYSVSLKPIVVKLGEHPTTYDPPEDDPEPVVRRDAIDFDPRSWDESRHASLLLPVAPVRGVLGVALRLPGMVGVVEFDRNWIHPHARRKNLSIYPGGTKLAAFPAQISTFALLALHGQRTIPNAWQVTYRAGYTPDDLAGPHADVLNTIGKLAALEMLVPGSIDVHLNAGVTGRNVSVDGLSQSLSLIQNAQALKFAPLMAAYSASVQEFAKTYEFRRGRKVGFL